MKVKMTNGEMINTVNRIVDMQNREEKAGTKLFSGRVKVLYAIKKNKDKLTQLLKPYEEARQELLQECRVQEESEDGSIKIRKDCIGKWNKAIEELLGIENAVEIHMVDFSELDGLDLSMNDMEAIDFMVREPENAQ